MYKCGGRCSITYMSRTDKRWRAVASVTNRHHWSDPLQIGYTEKPSASREQKFFLVDIKWVPKTLANNCERLNFSQVFRSSWIHPFEKRSYVPSSFCAIAFFFYRQESVFEPSYGGSISLLFHPSLEYFPGLLSGTPEISIYVTNNRSWKVQLNSKVIPACSHIFTYV